MNRASKKRRDKLDKFLKIEYLSSLKNPTKEQSKELANLRNELFKVSNSKTKGKHYKPVIAISEKWRKIQF